jgi:adenylate cyclase
VLADLIKIIDGAGAKMIALDVFLAELTWEDQDSKLETMITKSGKVILVSTFREKEGHRIVDLPHKRFLNGALATGLSDFPIDPIDQRVRQFRAYYLINGKKLPTLSVAMYLIDHGKKVEPDKQVDMEGFSWDWLPIKSEQIFINYQGPPAFSINKRNIFRTVPASVVLTGLVPGDWFRDKYVFIGAGYQDNPDAYRTPFYTERFNYALMPGVEIHANALATLISGRAPEIVSIWITLGIIILFSFLLLLLERVLNPTLLGFSALFLGTIYWIISFVVFDRSFLVLPIVPVSIGIIMVFTFLVTYRSLTEGRQKRWIKTAFSRYISPEFVEILLRKPDMLFLGGEERELTIMFTDIEGFTSISEGIPPYDLVSLLNDYLSGMTEILIKYGGTLDKYEGDAIMAFWGAPVEQEDHALRAVHAGVEMIRYTEQLSREFARQGKPSIKTRIGINTGTVVVGNVGSEKRFNYTIIGDEVNLASRLEGANKQYGTYLMISHSTRELVKDHFHLRELDFIKVKGKERPVRVYEVIAPLHDQMDESISKMLSIYNKGLEFYRKRRWKNALECFQGALEVCPTDGPSSTYVDRCRYFIDNPPGADWNGVFQLKTK